jgi:hypothetical protein
MKRYLILTAEGYRIVKGAPIWNAIAEVKLPIITIQPLNY